MEMPHLQDLWENSERISHCWLLLEGRLLCRKLRTNWWSFQTQVKRMKQLQRWKPESRGVCEKHERWLSVGQDSGEVWGHQFVVASFHDIGQFCLIVLF